MSGIINEVDTTPSQYFITIKDKRINEFDIEISGLVDSTNYYFSYITSVDGLGVVLNSTITSNTTLYVATTGSDDTGDGSSGNPYATVNGALDYLKDKKINTDVSVTIELDDGIYSNHPIVSPKHPDGDRITISGKNVYSKSLTSVQSSSGSTGSWSVVLNLSDVTNISVNDFILIPYSVTGGTNPLLLSGCWRITNVDSGNSRITIYNTTKYSSISSGLVTGTVNILKSIIRPTTYGIYMDSSERINIKDVIFDGNGNGSVGCILFNTSSIYVQSNVGFNGFVTGIYVIQNSSFKSEDTMLYSCNCSAISLRVQDTSQLIGNYGIYNGCGNGVYSLTGGFINVEYAVCVGNTYGLNSQAGNIKANGAVVNYNINYGILCVAGLIYSASVISSYNGISGVLCYSGGRVIATTSTITFNTSYGIQATNYGYVQIGSSSTVNNNGTNYSPALNTQGNEYGYIDS